VQKIQRVLELKRPVKVALVAILLLLVSVLLYPFQTTTVPAWSFRVVDDVGGPVGGVNVTEHWQHYLIESEGNEERKMTDVEGSVSFAERTVRASLLTRLLRTIQSLGETGAARRRNPYASAVVWGSKNHSVTTYVWDQLEPLPQHLVVARR
jgi:hypothetical protein